MQYQFTIIINVVIIKKGITWRERLGFFYEDTPIIIIYDAVFKISSFFLCYLQTFKMFYFFKSIYDIMLKNLIQRSLLVVLTKIKNVRKYKSTIVFQVFEV